MRTQMTKLERIRYMDIKYIEGIIRVLALKRGCSRKGS